jgi:O-acetylserine/cysteine efflux transporter
VRPRARPQAGEPDGTRPPPGLPLSHALLALAVVFVWGTNFVFMHVAVEALPPLFTAWLRFALACGPMLVLARPAGVPWRALAAYGALIGAGQFGLLFTALTGFVSPGLASLVVQTQVFFTIGLAVVFDGERVRRTQWLALAIAAGGLVLIAAAGRGSGDVTAAGLGLVLGAAACWAAGNQITRRLPPRPDGRPVPMLPFVVWSSVFALPPLALLSLAIEGPAAIAAGVQRADAAVWAAVAWQAVGNTLFGYAAWGFLLARHPAARVAPLALGVPVFGMLASAAWLGEAMPAWKWAAAALVIGGLALNARK